MFLSPLSLTQFTIVGFLTHGDKKAISVQYSGIPLKIKSSVEQSSPYWATATLTRDNTSFQSNGDIIADSDINCKLTLRIVYFRKKKAEPTSPALHLILYSAGITDPSDQVSVMYCLTASDFSTSTNALIFASFSRPLWHATMFT